MASSTVTLPGFGPLSGILDAVSGRPAPAALATKRDAGAGLSARTVHYLAECKGEPASRPSPSFRWGIADAKGFTLRKLYGLSHHEIARQLGISERTVEAQIDKAMRRCAAFLRERGLP